ncbi:uncharacterized protein BDW70DRAFT_135178 [Aspergillus foveolatus]|uniref:uncharacterized protein n=1 Tax=Aspergillus foveolatus TaxID=210207 RepID=UPI003CCCB26E
MRGPWLKVREHLQEGFDSLLAWPPLGSLALIASGQLLDVSLQLDSIGVCQLHPGPELMPRVGSGKRPLVMSMILLFRAG